MALATEYIVVKGNLKKPRKMIYFSELLCVRISSVHKYTSMQPSLAKQSLSSKHMLREGKKVNYPLLVDMWFTYLPSHIHVGKLINIHNKDFLSFFRGPFPPPLSLSTFITLLVCSLRQIFKTFSCLKTSHGYICEHLIFF